jgi:S1-C subfamily serine protease
LTRLRLEFLSGPRRGDVSVFSAARVSLGRSRSNTLVLPDTVAPAASARHAEFVRESGNWWIHDCGSTNGTFLNGSRVERAKLASGDRLLLGDLELQIDFDQSAPATAFGRRIGLGVAAVAVAAAGYWWFAVRPGLPQHIADMASRSVYLVVLDRAGARTIVGTAFEIADGGLLATNAHVANALQSSIDAGEASAVRPLAVRGDTYEAFRVDSIALHPEWHAGSIAHDVAIMRLRQSTDLAPLRLASSGAIQALRRGTSLATIGFPAVSTDPVKPRGRLSVDVLSDTRLPYLEVGLGIAPGTSGSPVFGPDGAVVGVVVSGDFVRGAEGAPMRPSGSNANWAISVDELRVLLESPGALATK